jgi:signal transduction histidine kinase
MRHPREWPKYLVLTAWAISLIRGTPGWAANAPLILTDAQDRYTVGLSLDILEDHDRTLTIAQIMSAEFQPRFIASTQANPNFGITTAAYWARLRIVNQTSATTAWRLEMDAALSNYLDLYLPHPDGASVEVRQTGALRPVASRDVFHRRFVFALNIQPGAEQLLYLRLETGWAYLPLTLWSARAFDRKAQQESLGFGLVYGALLVMSVYNLILWLVLRDRTYLYFVSSLIAQILFKASIEGFGQLYFWPNHYTIAFWAYPLFLSLLFLSGLQFASALLLTKTSAPQMHRLIQFCMMGWGILLGLFVFIRFGLILLLMHAFGVVNIALLFTTAVRVWRAGFRPARYYLLGWYVFFLVGLRSLFLIWGRGVDYDQLEITVSIGVVFPLVFFSLALADRITHFKQEREQAQAETLRLAQEHERFVSEQNLRLEDEVRKRTLQLEAEISERKQAESALQQMNTQLEQRVVERTLELTRAKESAELASLAKSNFLSSMSHELRTPLNHIIGFAEILGPQLADKMNDRQKKYCGYITQGGERLLELIDDVLELSRIDLGEMLLLPRELQLRPLLEQSLTAIRQKDLKPRLQVTLAMFPEDDEIILAADERKLKHILFNILSNAVKFTPDGGSITVEAARQAEDVLISVRDTGIGIAPEEQEKIFEPFYQILGGLRDKTPGVGLGLTLAKRFTELHGGRIWVESAGLGKGSCFYIALPLRGDRISTTGRIPYDTATFGETHHFSC